MLCSGLLLLVLMWHEKGLWVFLRWSGWIKSAFETVESTFCGDSMTEFFAITAGGIGKL